MSAVTSVDFEQHVVTDVSFLDHIDQGGTEPGDPSLEEVNKTVKTGAEGSQPTHGVLENPVETTGNPTSQNIAAPTMGELRKQTPLAPSWVNVEKWDAGPLTRCGCGSCPESVHPLTDDRHVVEEDGDERVRYANQGVCDSPRPLTVEEAGDVFLAYVGSAYNDPRRVAEKVDDQREKYGRILDADRRFQEEYDNLTTVLLSLRQSPIDDDGTWIEPWRLDNEIRNPHDSVRSAIKTTLDGIYDWKYCVVYTGTERFATPHSHWYIWIDDDPANPIEKEDFDSVIDKHLKHCDNAEEEDHLTDPDGRDGAISIRSNPKKATDKLDVPPSEAPTRGAVYVASQLPYLSIMDAYEDGVDHWRLEIGAICWASPNHWFSSSRGI